MKTGSIWRERKTELSFPELNRDIEADVVIVGGGITGITSAMLLTEADKKIVLLEAFQIGSGTTGFSSNHLTTDIDEKYRNLSDEHDLETAGTVAESRMAAIDFIEKTVNEKQIDCDFRRLPGYLYTEIPEDLNDIRNEEEAASKSGLKVRLTDSLPLPFKIKKALRFENQAEFNSQQYLDELANYITLQNGLIFENSAVRNLEEREGYYILKTDSGSVKAKQIIIATHLPIFLNVLQMVAAPYMSYMMAAKLKSPEHPVGLFWDSEVPYHYIRYYEKDNINYVVVGGEDHKTGHESNTEARYAKLEKYIRSKFDIESIDYRWAAQYYKPADGLPYIGKSPFAKNIFVATGFSGDGLVYGTISGIILSDMILGVDNAWLKIYNAGRFTPAASAYDFIKENADVAKNFLKDRLAADVDDVSLIMKGEGKIANINGEKLGVFRDENDELHAVSPVCTHLKCIVHWNQSSMSWDCPCHGSRYNMKGEVLCGPAVKALEQKDVKAVMENSKIKNPNSKG